MAISRHSFKYALTGLRHVLSKERNARFHIFMALLVVAVALYLNYFRPELALSTEELAALIFAILLVFVSEIINTAIERTVDFIPRAGRPTEVDEAVGTAKDIMAGAVLVSAAGAIVIGILIFGPRVLILLAW